MVVFIQKTNIGLSNLIITFVLFSSITFAYDIEFGTNASISASDYLAYDRFNRTDSTTIGSLATGQSWAEIIGDSEIADKMLKQSFTSTEAVYFNQALNSTTTKNYTIDWIARVDAISGDEWRDLLIRGAVNCGGSYATIGVDGDGANQDMGILLSNGSRHKLSPATNWFNLKDTTVLYRAHVNVTHGSINLTAYNVSEVNGVINLEEIASKSHVAYSMLTSASSICIEYSDNSANTLNTTELAIYNGTTRPGGAAPVSDITPPEITYYNVTNDAGCENWNTDKNNACSVSSATPTIQFDTNKPAYCAISGNFSLTSGMNYTNMGSTRNCTGAMSGEGIIFNHRCTLTSQDALVYETSYVHISCKDASGNQNRTSTSGALKVYVASLEADAKSSIGLGVQNALLSGYTSYTNQQIFARRLLNLQVKGTFDFAAKKGAKTWAFNRIGISDVNVNMFNLTPVLYTLEIANKTSAQITNQVELLINATK